ncbi:MAG: CDP-diacylglycerol--glycerol-3-phosphate 3-phosphatidyltransferase [Oscillospiraceae bacterium]|nr:CDP-diacylglycerol--glycerol-3-phosphate 3-phosphatidyltransferase [Oscillospiraceae bacterium]MDD6085641.1 CDP-diacylglycerol--glycerol-3-phosphate 3-phosphatidyltransferase [Oscillospiraceae bacterium]MDY3257106.1 CDP-diacylglycerol--glycerol-3-phosphate 3-phosphatidyltransferase [Ruminococcus callidus]
MNLPNKLTVLRVILVPVFLIFTYVSAIPYHYILALVVFAAASITDMLDGKIARKHNLVTNFGKFLDPLADKILVISALMAFVDIKDYRLSAIPVIIIIIREFTVSGLRLVTASEGVVVAAGIWGKLKTAFTMVGIVAVLLCLSIRYDFAVSPENCAWDSVMLGCNIVIWIAAVLTIISGAVYLKGYWKYINPKE